MWSIEADGFEELLWVTLGEWEALGADVSEFVGLTGTSVSATDVFHAHDTCVDVTVAPAHPVTLELDTKLCFDCWPAAVPIVSQYSAAALNEFTLLSRPRTERVSPEGRAVYFVYMLRFLEDLPFQAPVLGGCTGVARAAAVLDLESSFVGGHAASLEAALDAAGLAAVGPGEALVSIRLGGLMDMQKAVPTEIFDVLTHLWVDSIRGLVVFRGPTDVLDAVFGSAWSAGVSFFSHSCVTLDEADTPSVLDTALSILDPDNENVSSVRAALRHARLLCAAPVGSPFS